MCSTEAFIGGVAVVLAILLFFICRSSKNREHNYTDIKKLDPVMGNNETNAPLTIEDLDGSDTDQSDSAA